MATPDDHFIAGPYSGVSKALIRCSADGSCNPTVCARIVSAAGIQVNSGVEFDSTPDNHFSARPDRCGTYTIIGRVDSADACPTVRAWIISPAGAKRTAVVASTPHYHLAAGPDCCLIITAIGRVSNAGRGPGIISAFVAGVREFR